MATSVVAGKRKYSTIIFADHLFADNGITKVSEIEFRMTLSVDDGSWLHEQFFDDIFKYNP